MASSSTPTTTIPFESKMNNNQPHKPHKNPTKPNASELKTPEKSDQRRVRSRNRAVSVSEIRRAAQKLQGSDPRRSGKEEEKTGLDSRVRVLEKDVIKKRSEVKATDLVKLPKKHEVLCEFFNAMVSSFQLLRLKRSSSTFENISAMVESLMGRRFTSDRLAQMKYILPEAILIKRIRVKDEETSCMREELFITLDADALKTNENAKGVGGPSLLKKVFRSRVSEYHQTHSEDDDISKGSMPTLLNPPKDSSELNTSGSNGVSKASHNPPSFRKCFPQKALSDTKESISSVLGSQTRGNEDGKTDILGSLESSSKQSKLVECSISQLPLSSVLTTPSKAINSLDVSSSSKGACKTPASLVSTPARLMTSTPSLKPEKRRFTSPDGNSIVLPKKLLRRSDRIKSLKFGPLEDEAIIEDQKDQLQGSISDDDLDFLPESLLQSVREEERKMLEDKDPAISQAKRRHQMMAKLPQLFDMIHLLFQSIGRTVITKKELMYKIIVGHREIVDRGEVEEQLKLLQELAPEFLSEQLCSSGDTLIRFNKFSCTESIRAKLLDAK
ncbi:hypothetical protein Drorol1_Dr00003821 [Drosera rotundifolia]